MAAIDNAARLRRYIEEIDPRGDVDALPEYVQEDVALPADTTPRVPIAQPNFDVAMQKNIKGYRYWFHLQPDYRNLEKA